MNIGDTIDNKYLVVDDLGAGGMGHVYKVTDGAKEVALKVCIDTDEERQSRFRREVRMMQRISDVNVIHVEDFNPASNPLYFTMPLCKYSLDKQINILYKNHKAALQFLIDGCKGVRVIHESGNIHRDIKPQNFLIDQNDIIKVSDLGLGKFVERDTTVLTSANVVMGTRDYIPPEFFTYGGTLNADARSDIYQLGKTIYVVLTNQSPSFLNSTLLPAAIFYIIKKASDNNPDKRYQSVHELITALEQYLKSLDESKDPEKIFADYLEKMRDARSSLTVTQLFEILYMYQDQPDRFFKLFHAIPLSYLKNTVSSDPDLNGFLKSAYVPVIESYLDNYSSEFEDADKIADSMEAIFYNAKDIELKTEALYITLKAAVKKNRYDAMDKVKTMLELIKSNEDARIIKEMLRINIEDFSIIANRYPDLKLNYLISELKQGVIDEQATNQYKSNEGDVSY